MLKSLAFILALMGAISPSPAFAEEDQFLSLTLTYKEGSGRPTTEEFILASKRVFYTRGYEYNVVSDSIVKGVYKSHYKCSIIDVLEGAEIICQGRRESAIIKGYVKNLAKDLKYELGKYLL